MGETAESVCNHVHRYFIGGTSFICHRNGSGICLYDGSFSGALGKRDQGRCAGSRNGAVFLHHHVFVCDRRRAGTGAGNRGDKAEPVLYYGKSAVVFPACPDLYERSVYGLCLCGDQYDIGLRSDHDTADGKDDRGGDQIYDHESSRFGSFLKHFFPVRQHRSHKYREQR